MQSNFLTRHFFLASDYMSCMGFEKKFSRFSTPTEKIFLFMANYYYGAWNLDKIQSLLDSKRKKINLSAILLWCIVLKKISFDTRPWLKNCFCLKYCINIVHGTWRNSIGTRPSPIKNCFCFWLRYYSTIILFGNRPQTNLFQFFFQFSYCTMVRRNRKSC